jgi:hypothetical protein
MPSSQSSTIDLTLSSSQSDRSSVAEHSLPPSSSPPVPSRESPVSNGPGYDLWVANWWSRFTNCVLAPSANRQRSWWWLHGYRLKQTDGGSAHARILWVCGQAAAAAEVEILVYRVNRPVNYLASVTHIPR